MAEQDSNAGTRLPAGFDFVRLLGRGGAGYVVLANDVALGRLVAIKMLHGGMLGLGGSARLQREGQALAALRHPNVVRVFAALPAGHAGEDLALVTEYIAGATLEEATRLRYLSRTEILTIMAGVASAVEHFAELGIVHRDLKPSNVLLALDGQAKVADFGTARLSHAAAAFRTASGVVTGTPGYWAPEQVTDPDSESPAIDRYGFAATAYYMLTAQTPSDAHSAMNALIEQGFPEQTARLFATALSNEPTSRPLPSVLVEQLQNLAERDWPALQLRASSPGATATIGAEDDGLPQELSSPTTGSAAHSHRITEWINTPVFVPTSQRRWLADFPLLWGCLLGIGVVLLVIVLWR